MATFILVHGTYAKSANWPTLQAGLAEAARAVGESPSFEQLTWSGKNRANARQAAALAILGMVQKIRSTSGNEKIFAIGHSHGGSAIAYFLKQYPDVAKSLGGCAFLSTPFVAIRPRKETLRLVFVLIYLPIAAAMMLWDQIMSPHEPSYFAPRRGFMDWLWERQPSTLWWALGLVAAILMSILLYFSKASKPHRLMEQSMRQETANIPDGNYFFVRCSGDEAAAALSAVQFIAWLGIKVSKLLEILIGPFVSPRSITQTVSGFLLFPLIYILVSSGWFIVIPQVLKYGVFNFFFSPQGPFLFFKDDPIYMAFMVFAFVLPSLFFLALLAALLIFLTQALTSWAFGWTRLSTGFLVELAIEPLPFGEHRLVHIDWETGSIGMDGIVHSWTYAHPDAILHLENWVKASLRNCP